MKKRQHLKVGELAPDFTLPSQSGERVSLKEFRGKRGIVLFFYPKDFTLVCTKEACAFRDSYQTFIEAGVEVFGISADSSESHGRFAAENRLPYRLLSDEEDRVRRLYGVPRTLGLFPGRVTYVVDKKGVIRHIFSSALGAEKHVKEALKRLADE